MKRFIILGLSCLPLLWLTVNSFRAPDAVAQGEPSQAARLDLAEISAKADEAKRVSDANRPFLRELAKLEMFSEGPLRKLSAVQIDDFKPIVENWSTYCKTSDPCVRLAGLYRQSLTAEKEKDELEVFLRGQPFPEGIRGKATLEEFLKQRVAWIDGKTSTRWKLERARKALDQGRYDETLSNLVIADDLLEPREREEAERMRRKAKFRKHWASSSENASDTPLERLQWLLKAPPEPVDDDDRKLQADRTLERDILLRKAQLDELLASTEPLETRLDKIRRLAAQDATGKPIIRTKIREWVELLLPRKKPPAALVGLQEGWYKNGKYRRGVFVPMSPLSVTDKFFHVWDDVAARNARPLFYDTIYESELSGQPRKMLPVSIVEDFNVKRDQLLRTVSKEDSWRKFKEFCESQQHDVEKYYQEVAKEQEERVSLVEEQKAIKQILEVWESFHELMDTSKD